MNITQLKCLWEVASRGSFTKAAEELYLSQSAVSKNILSLEKELGIKLINRNGKNFSISEDGRSMIRHYREILEAYDHSIETLHQIKMRGKETGQHVDFACIPVVSAYGIVASLRHFSLLHPDVKIHMNELEEDSVLFSLESEDCHLAFCSTLRIDPAVYDSQFYSKEEMMAIVSKDSPLTQKEAISIQDLHGMKLILNRKESMLYDLCYDACTKAEFVPDVVFTTSRPEIAFELMFRQDYVYVGIKRMLQNVSEDAFHLLPIENSPTFEYHFVWKKSRRLSKIAQEYLSFIQTYGDSYFIKNSINVTYNYSEQ
jgi:DNA-binding transcriptional LysR family regulator